MFAELILPWSLLALGAIWGVVMDRLASWRRADGERGDYWQRVAASGLYPLTAWLVWSRVVVAQGWPPAWALYLGQTDGDHAYWLALALPFVLWAWASALCLLAQPEPATQPRWLAGGVGFANSRHWLLACGLPLLLSLLFTAGDLGGGEGAYPASVWSGLAVAWLTLLGLAFSAGRVEADKAPETPRKATASPLKAWPEWLAAHGIQAKTLFTWPTGGLGRAVQGAEAAALAGRLQALGAPEPAPELLEGVAALLQRQSSGDEHGAARLIFAPDGCGQAETVSLAADLLNRQFHTVTLVVTPQDAESLASELRRWLPEAGQKVAALGYGEIPDPVLLWVVEAEFLSDRLLARLKDPALACRIGLVVWWRLQDYSGVMAANLWAISRRLHRLLRAQGRPDIRTLALLRPATPDAQLGNFVRRLLPHAQPAETHVEQRLRQPVSLYLLAVPAAVLPGQYLLLRTAATSVAGGWPTFLQATDFITRQELAQFRQSLANGQPMAAQLRLTASEANAHLLHLRPAEVLALPYMTGLGGHDGLPQHIGIMPPANPYARHLLEQLAKGKTFPGSRRLVCAESCPAIIRRHLLLALNELPDTRRGLLQNALWDEQVVGDTLRELAKAGQLTRREVRFLDDNDRLVSEFEYQSLQMPPGHFSPLDTVGLQLLEVREGDAVRLRVDPERLLIAAYPGRVFMRQGQRYRIRDWHSLDEVTARGWMECQREDQCHATWRSHTATVFGIRPWRGESEVAIGRPGALTRLAVELKYQEEVTGVVEWTADPLRHPQAEPSCNVLVNPHSLTFKTRALVLRLLTPPRDTSALPSLCQALREVLPVHLGVEEDALEVVGLNGVDINGEDAYGLAIVDLYPGGIGLTDAIRDDSAFLLRLLQWTRDWLDACPDNALHTPLALATNPDQAPQRQAALQLLEQIL